VNVTPIHPLSPDRLTNRPVLLLLPMDAATVAAGTPVAATTVCSERVLVLPDGAAIDEQEEPQIPAVPLSRYDALRVAAGASVRARTLRGQDIEVRPPTMHELAVAHSLAAADAAEAGTPAAAPLTHEAIEKLTRPLDLAELATALIAGGQRGTTRVDRTALMLQVAGHDPATTPVNSPHESALMAALIPLQGHLANAVEAMTRLAGDPPESGYREVGHLMLADLQQMQRLLRLVLLEFDRIVSFR